MPVTYEDLDRPPLDANSLNAALTRPGSLWRTIEVLTQTPSTNAVVVERARAGEVEGLVLVAEHQTAGRGRMNRVWVTPPRVALTLSLLLTPDRVPVARWPWLPLLAGIAVSEAVHGVADLACDLKWPNDVLVADRKLAGILVERAETSRGPVAVVGIGLNVSSTRAELPSPTATSLALEGGATLDRSVLLRQVLRCFEALYAQWLVEDGDPACGLRESYVRRCVTLGQMVHVDLPTGERVHGEATGIDVEGHLQVRTDDGPRVLGAGDVVHVRAG